MTTEQINPIVCTATSYALPLLNSFILRSVELIPHVIRVRGGAGGVEEE